MVGRPVSLVLSGSSFMGPVPGPGAVTRVPLVEVQRLKASLINQHIHVVFANGRFMLALRKLVPEGGDLLAAGLTWANR